MATKRLNEVELSRREVEAASEAVAEALVRFENAQREYLLALRQNVVERLEDAFSVGQE